MTLVAMPMFPLDTVLFPGLGLPLHIFEPRYRSLVADCLEGDRQFGVVLIERGHEVGGGDARFGVGTVARIVQEDPAPDGRWVLLAVGSRRIRIEHWLPDAPYPLALVKDIEEDPPTNADRDEMARIERQVRRALAYAAELDDGPTVPSTVELAEEPEAKCWELCAMSPLALLDHQRLLEAPTVPGRLALLSEMTESVCEDLLARLTS